MTQSPYGPPDGPGEYEPARAADQDWTTDPDPAYPAGSGFVAGTGYPATPAAPTGAYAYEPGYAASTDEPTQTSDVAKQEASDLKDTAADRGRQVADTAKEQATQVKDTALEQGAQVAGTAKDEAVKVKDEATTQVKDLIAQSRSELGSQASTQQNRLAGIVHDFADELGSMASASDKSGPLTDLVHTGSRKGGELAHWLQDNEPSDLLEQVKSFARRRPVAFLAGSVLAGVVVGRLTRSAVDESRAEHHDAIAPTTTTPVDYAPATYAEPVTSTYTDPAAGTYTDPAAGYASEPAVGYTNDPYAPGYVAGQTYPDAPLQGGYR